MERENLVNTVEEIISCLLEELGHGSEREEVTECALLNVVYGYFNNQFTLEDVIETSKYLDIPIDIDEIQRQKENKIKRKQHKAAC